MSELENKKDENKRWLWIIGGIAIIGVIGLIFYFTSSKSGQKPPNPSNIQYLPVYQEAQAKIDEIKINKGIDEF